MYHDVKVLQLCQQEVSNGAPLLPTEQKLEPTLKMLSSPKYYCELAGEGVEFSWGFMRRNFWNFSLNEKKHKREVQ